MPKVPKSETTVMEVGGVPVVNTTSVKHPATYSQSVLDALDILVPDGMWLDPFVGVGKLYSLTRDYRFFYGCEIEPEWANEAWRYVPMRFLGEESRRAAFHTEIGDCRDTMRKWIADGRTFDGVVSSPVYGNRMSDHHNAKDASTRRSYKFDLGRNLTEGNSGVMYFWQPAYAEFHEEVAGLVADIVRPGGKLFWNVKNFLKTKNGVEHEYDVVSYYLQLWESYDFNIKRVVDVPTPGMRYGENHEVRIDSEKIIVAKRRK